MWVINKLPNPWKLRVEAEGEVMGLDNYEHGTEAYSEHELPDIAYVVAKKPTLEYP